MIIGIDHILIAVQDLDLAIEVYQQLGLQVLRGGDHPKMGTRNALVPLADGTYLELIGIWDETLADQMTPNLVRVMHSENRLANFALESDDLDADVAAIRARGFEFGDVREGERLRPDGVRVAWRSAMPADPHLPFLIQDTTPRTTRIPAPTEGIGRNLRFGDVNVGVTDLAGAQDAYQKLLGVQAEEGWFELTRGAILLQDVDTERVLQIVLEADNPLELVNAWQAENVPFDQQILGGMGITLQPVNTLGAPIAITGRVS